MLICKCFYTNTVRNIFHITTWYTYAAQYTYVGITEISLNDTCLTIWALVMRSSYLFLLLTCLFSFFHPLLWSSFFSFHTVYISIIFPFLLSFDFQLFFPHFTHSFLSFPFYFSFSLLLRFYFLFLNFKSLPFFLLFLKC